MDRKTRKKLVETHKWNLTPAKDRYVYETEKGIAIAYILRDGEDGIFNAKVIRHNLTTEESKFLGDGSRKRAFIWACNTLDVPEMTDINTEEVL